MITRFAAFASFAFVAGCVSPHVTHGSIAFVPQTPRRASVGASTATLTHADVITGRTGDLTGALISIRIDADDSWTLTEARLALPDSLPCSGGLDARDTWREMQRAPLPLHHGSEQQIRLLFETESRERIPLTEYSVLDLRIAASGRNDCLRLPFSGPDAAWAPAKSWLAGLGGRVHSPFRDTPDLGVEGTLSVLIGVWLRPDARIWLEPGIGPITDISRAVFSVGGHAEYVLVQHSGFAAGVSLGYTARTTSTGYGAPQYRTIHGPQLAVRLKLVRPLALASGFPGGVQHGGWELILPLDYWFGMGAERDSIGLIGGFGIAHFL